MESVIAASRVVLAEARAQSAARAPAESSVPRRVATASARAETVVDLQPAVSANAESRTDRGADALAPSDEEGPPLDVIVGSESSEVVATGASPTRAPRRDDDAGAVPAPPLAELTGRVPPALHEVMEELFRARFVRVARVPDAAPDAPAKAKSGS